jgi:hypothetical protein
LPYWSRVNTVKPPSSPARSPASMPFTQHLAATATCKRCDVTRRSRLWIRRQEGRRRGSASPLPAGAPSRLPPRTFRTQRPPVAIARNRSAHRADRRLLVGAHSSDGTDRIGGAGASGSAGAYPPALIALSRERSGVLTLAGGGSTARFRNIAVGPVMRSACAIATRAILKSI